MIIMIYCGGGVLKIQSCPPIFNQQASRTTTACVRAGGGLVDYYFLNNGQPTTTAAVWDWSSINVKLQQ